MGSEGVEDAKRTQILLFSYPPYKIFVALSKIDSDAYFLSITASVIYPLPLLVLYFKPFLK